MVDCDPRAGLVGLTCTDGPGWSAGPGARGYHCAAQGRAGEGWRTKVETMVEKVEKGGDRGR